MAGKSKNLLEALDGIREALAHKAPYHGVIIEYPQIAIGPVEEVLGFNTNEHHVLKEADTPTPYFSNQGVITDLQGRVLPGSRIETSFRIDVSKIGATTLFPPEQPPPFDEPPSIPTNAEPLGFSKQAYFFADGSSLVTVGPAVPKVLRLKDGGAHLWVSSAGVVAQGKGRYEGARGMSGYAGSAYFPNWPATPPEQLQLLAAGFEVRSSAFFKLVLKADQA